MFTVKKHITHTINVNFPINSENIGLVCFPIGLVEICANSGKNLKA